MLKSNQIRFYKIFKYNKILYQIKLNQAKSNFNKMKIKSN